MSKAINDKEYYSTKKRKKQLKLEKKKRKLRRNKKMGVDFEQYES